MIKIPLNSLVVMVGPSGAGKSTFIANHFGPHEVVSTDALRQELLGDFRNQQHFDIIFNEFRRRITLKLQMGQRVVADATHLKRKDRLDTAKLGTELGLPVFYIVINRSLEEKVATAGHRSYHVMERMEKTFQGQEKTILQGDNIATVIDTRTNSNFEVIAPFNFDGLSNDLLSRNFTSLEVIGDVHGEFDAFKAIVDQALSNNRMILQLGDIVDYGPQTVKCLTLIYSLVMNGQAIMIIGNHERKFERYIKQYRDGAVKVKVTGGLAVTVEQLDRLSTKKRTDFENKFLALMNHMRHHVVINDNLMFVHGSSTERMWKTRSNRLFGEDENRAVFGQTDGFKADGFPNRIYTWVDEIPFSHIVYVGHDVRQTTEPLIHQGNSGGTAIFLDTGSSKGGKLSSMVQFIDH